MACASRRCIVRAVALRAAGDRWRARRGGAAATRNIRAPSPRCRTAARPGDECEDGWRAIITRSGGHAWTCEAENCKDFDDGGPETTCARRCGKAPGCWSRVVCRQARSARTATTRTDTAGAARTLALATMELRPVSQTAPKMVPKIACRATLLTTSCGGLASTEMARASVCIASSSTIKPVLTPPRLKQPTGTSKVIAAVSGPDLGLEHN